MFHRFQPVQTKGEEEEKIIVIYTFVGSILYRVRMRSFRHYSKNFKPTFCWFTLLYTLVKSSVKNAQIKFSHFYHCVLWSRMLVSCDVMALFFLKEKWTKKSSRKKKDENALEYFHSSFRHFIQFTFFPATFKYNFKNWLNLHTNILLLFRILYQRIIIDIILTWLTSAFYPFARSLSLFPCSHSFTFPNYITY